MQTARNTDRGKLGQWQVQLYTILKQALRWKKDLDSKLILDNGQPIPAILVANKCDLENNLNEHQIAELAKQGGFSAGFVF